MKDAERILNLESRIEDLEKQLDVANARFIEIIHSLSDRFILFDRNLDIIEVNDPYLIATGKQRTDLIGHNLLEFFPEFKSSRRYREFMSVVETGVPIQIEDFFRDDRYGDVYESVRMFKVGSGIGVLARDISDFRKMIQTLQESQATTHVLMNAGSDSAFLLTAERDVLAVNDPGCKQVNRDKGEIIGQCIDLLAPPAVATARKTWFDALMEHRRPLRYEIEHEGRFFGEQLFPIFGEHGTVERIVLCSREMTDEKQRQREQMSVEAHLRKLQKLETLGTLASGIAHDFNNILTPILGYTDLAMQHIQQPDRALAFLDNVRVAGKRARELVKQILTFSRQVDQERHPIHAHYVINEIIRLIRATLPLNIEFQHQVDSHCGVICVDPSQIHQVVMNLSTNSIHAMKARGGVLSIRLAQYTADEAFKRLFPSQTATVFAAIQVSDTGHGMDQATQERIFEPFFTTKQPGEGTGLGLSVVHGIVKAHHGEIRVRSNPGVGSTFTVYLPIVETEAEIEMLKEDSSHRGTGRILIVDDEQIIVDMVADALVQNGYSVMPLISSREALEVFKRKPDAFDLVITDLAMPHLNGTELAREIIAIRPSIPIMLTTGFSETIALEQMHQIGIRTLLLKPLIPRELFKAIRNILETNDSN